MWLIFPPPSYPLRPSPIHPHHHHHHLSWWLPCPLSLSSRSVCAVALYVKIKSSLLILGSVTRLPFCDGQWATGPGLPYHTVHSCPSLPYWSRITYLGRRNEFVCTHFWELVGLQWRELFWYSSNQVWAQRTATWRNLYAQIATVRHS